MNLKTRYIKRTQSRTEIHWRKRKRLTRWSEFTDRQSRSGSECGKAGPDKLEPEALTWVGSKEEKRFLSYTHLA